MSGTAGPHLRTEQGVLVEKGNKEKRRATINQKKTKKTLTYKTCQAVHSVHAILTKHRLSYWLKFHS